MLRSRSWRSSVGFSLLEMMVVLAIIGVALVFVVPALSVGFRHWQLQGAARELVVLFKFTRNQAVSRREPLQAVLDRERGMYWTDSAGPSAAQSPDEADRKGIRLYPLPSGVRFGDIIVEGNLTSDGRARVVFSPRGTASEASVQLLGEGARTYQILVDSVTGHARVAH